MSDNNMTALNGRARRLRQNVAVAAVAGIAFGALTTLTAVAADGSPLPIKSISVDAQKNLIVKFTTHAGIFPGVPHLLDLPGPNHRVVLDFANAAIEKGALADAEDLSKDISHEIPAVKDVRYSNLTNTQKPTARLVVDLPETVAADPRVVKLDETSITISLGEAVATAPAPAPASADNNGGPQVSDNTIDGVAPAAQPPATPAAAETAGAPPPAAETAAATTPAPANTVQQNAASGGKWDWSGSAMTPTVTPNEGVSPRAQSEPAIAANNLDGVAPANTTPAQTAAQPETAELKPAIPAGDSSTTAAAAADVANAANQGVSDTALSSAPPAQAQPTPSRATLTEPSAGGRAAAVKLYNSAVKNHLNGKLAEAISDYKGAIAADGSLAEAHSNLGLIYNQQHDYAGALSEFRKALAINPRDAITYNGIGAALRAEHDLPGAIKNWQTAVSLDPHLATAHYNLGTAYELQRDPDRALVSYQEAVKNDYRLGEAYYRMGLILQRKNKKDDAAEQFKQALKASTSSEYSDDARQQLASLSKGAPAGAKKQ